MRDKRDMLFEFEIAVVSSVGAALVGGVVWIVRRVFINKKQTEAMDAKVTLLAKEIALREEHRKEERTEDRKSRADLKEDVRQVRAKVDRLAERGLSD